MPLDKVVLNHLDEMDTIEDKIEQDISDVLSAIDIKAIMQDPETAMLQIATEIQSIMEEEYFVKAVENGITFAKKVVADGDIKVQRTKDPEANA